MRTWWLHISDPSLWPSERLFFEVYVQALHRRGPTSELLDGVVESWVAPATAIGESRGGVPHDEARAMARLGLAVTRGLLLDLLATGDRAGVDAAMERWIAVLEHSGGGRSTMLERPLPDASRRPRRSRQPS
jgi:hypothetical protein